MANPENSKLFEVEENKEERTNDENVSNLVTCEVLQKDTVQHWLMQQIKL